VKYLKYFIIPTIFISSDVYASGVMFSLVFELLAAGVSALGGAITSFFVSILLVIVFSFVFIICFFIARKGGGFISLFLGSSLYFGSLLFGMIYLVHKAEEKSLLDRMIELLPSITVLSFLTALVYFIVHKIISKSKDVIIKKLKVIYKMKELELKTKEVYEENAEAFDKQRSKELFEKKWLDCFLSHLKEGDHVLDVGCGAGDPIAAYLIDQKIKVTGLDFSNEMMKLFKSRFPQNDYYVQDMRKLNLDKKFNGIIAWNSFFHLTQEDQRSTFALFDKHLSKDGVVMMTVGPEEGEVEGHVNKKRVYHSSISPEGYKSLLKKYHFEMLEFVPEDPECNGHTILLAKK